MVDGTEYNVRNIATNVKDFYRNAIAPYGMGMSFMPVIDGTLINTANIISIKEMNDDEVREVNESEEVREVNEPEEVVGLVETDGDVENLESEQPEDIQ